MKNIYLEKIALSHGQFQGLMTGTGAVLGGIKGYIPKGHSHYNYDSKKDTYKEVKIKYTKERRIANAAMSAALGGATGYFASNLLKGRPAAGSYNYKKSNPNGGTSHHDILNKVNAKENDFSRKADVEKHFKTHLHRNHPDKHNQSPASVKKFQDLSTARDALKETDWFKKLAAVRDLRALAYMKKGRKSYKELAVKFNVGQKKRK